MSAIVGGSAESIRPQELIASAAAHSCANRFTFIPRLTVGGSAAGASGALGAHAARVTEAIRRLQPLVRCHAAHWRSHLSRSSDVSSGGSPGARTLNTNSGEK